MANYFNILVDTSLGTFNWVVQLIKFEVPWYQNYFYGLIAISLVVYMLELLFPWRKNQKAIRKDFWLDTFYMFFNFFIFSIIISGLYAVIQEFANSIGLSMQSIALVNLEQLPMAIQLILFFVVLDFVQWLTHVALHSSELLWRFHKVHHSVKEMGFAAHLRYHWMENILYKPLKTIALMVLGGVEPSMAFAVHFFAILIGHLNHANIKITWGPLKYIFNNSVMHLWHHAKYLPKDRKRGVNYGISLSIWDYIFKTNYIPNENADIELGFEGDENFPSSFIEQSTFGFK